MNKRRIWFQREFELGLPPEAFPDLVERLRGTPARLSERSAGLNATALTTRVDGAWSVQEHAGHLLDLESLWTGRISDLRKGESTLRPADLSNTKTEEAKHNEASLEKILGEFRTTRLAWIKDLDDFDAELIRRTALHPRLEKPMSVVDLAFFVAEHDDHHLATITNLRRAAGAG